MPDKLYFKIGEVAGLVGVETHVLRYWEREIPFIRPSKTVSNQRRYRRKDVEVFREIRRLLHDERYTLAGARRRLLGGERPKDGQEVAVTPATVSAEPALVKSASGARAAAAASAPSARPGATDRQLPLGFTRAADDKRVARLTAGLKELVRMCGEEAPER
ncbi:MAG: MerR family transcriptional regulator [Deltaproteobacteria bacterium]|nr:MerR family transcriptional regulator [Deltaproteobacteria bacterium]